LEGKEKVEFLQSASGKIPAQRIGENLGGINASR
jgi:hypothetical protein